MKENNASMFIYSTDWYGQRTFRMLPLSEECPFNEAIYDPNAKVLAVISKDQKEKPQMLPKLNDKGQVIPLKNSSNPAEKTYIEERRMMDTYYEYYIDTHEDIKTFVSIFAFNPSHSALAILDASASSTAV